MAKSLGPVKRKFSPWTDPAAVPFIRFENITKRFGDFVAVRNLSLDIYEKEFFSLLGPSGCGKTTTLRMVALSSTASRVLAIAPGFSTCAARTVKDEKTD